MIAITDEYTKEIIYSREDVAKILMKFYEAVKHGDEEHQTWLRHETLRFIAREFTPKKEE